MHILITGCAGFIGYHISKRLLKETTFKIYGIDNLNSYYDVKLKKNRLALLKKNKYFKFYSFDLSNYKKTLKNPQNKFQMKMSPKESHNDFRNASRMKNPPNKSE